MEKYFRKWLCLTLPSKKNKNIYSVRETLSRKQLYNITILLNNKQKMNRIFFRLLYT